MPLTKMLPVRGLALDLKNYRTLPQKKEIDAIHALISIDTDWYWALMESLIADGCLPTENIIVLDTAGKLVVREGNRRVSALKIIHGYISSVPFDLPPHIQESVDAISAKWKKDNQEIPCTIYNLKEAKQVNRVVSLIHGKGEKAGRVSWNAIARARHNRDESGDSEPALDLFEKYLVSGKNLNSIQKERWAGEYPLSVLEEAIKRLAPRLGVETAPDLAKSYPNIKKYKTALDDILRDIGLQQIRFEHIRSKDEDYAFTKYDIPPLAVEKGSAQNAGKKANQASNKNGSQSKPQAKAAALDSPRAVSKTLRDFAPRGNGREKVVTVLEEMRRLKLDKHPHAFCFLLRSMFEISAKAYCKDHAPNGPKATSASGEDRRLVDILRDIKTHIVTNAGSSGNSKRAAMQTLHGAVTEIEKSSGILSVTSMNQLVHNPRFSIKERDICSLFHNVFPMLEEMNR